MARPDPDSFPDPFSRPSAALMAPGATRSFQIQPSGDLYNGVWRVRIDASEDARPAAAPHRIAYEERWLPVAYWAERAKHLRWDFEAVAELMPEPWIACFQRSINDKMIGWGDSHAISIERRRLTGRLGDRLDRVEVRFSRHPHLRDDEVRPLAVSLEARVTNLDRVAHVARLAVTFVAADSSQPWREDKYHRPKPIVWGWADTAATVAIGVRSRAAADSLERGVLLQPGESRVIHFTLASHPAPISRLAAWAQTTHEQRVAETREFWQREVARGMTLDLADNEVESAVAAARVVLLSLRERRSGDWVPLGGPFHYRDVWLRDGARAIQALALNGYVGESRAMARGFLQWQWVHGPFVSQDGQLDGTGQALWAFEQAMLRPAPASDVGRYAQSAWNAVEWCERVRAIDRERGTAFSNMLPKTDPHDAELVDAQLVGNDAWALAGYRSAERLLRAANRPAEADRVEQQRLGYRMAFARNLKLAGAPDIPPSWIGKGLDWGNLNVAVPCAALPPDQPRVEALAERYWSRVGGAGLGFYDHPTALHGYVAVDLGTRAMLVDDMAEADSVLAATLHWRNASGGACELFDGKTGDYGVNLPPHATSAAALLTLVRNALIYDDGDRLQLTMGARDSWWAHGGHVDRAPTRWGWVSFDFARRGNVASWNWTPVQVWTELRLPPGARLDGTPPAPLLALASGRGVLAPPGTAVADVRVR